MLSAATTPQQSSQKLPKFLAHPHITHKLLSIYPRRSRHALNTLNRWDIPHTINHISSYCGRYRVNFRTNARLPALNSGVVLVVCERRDDGRTLCACAAAVALCCAFYDSYKKFVNSRTDPRICCKSMAFDVTNCRAL